MIGQRTIDRAIALIAASLTCALFAIGAFDSLAFDDMGLAAMFGAVALLIAALGLGGFRRL